MPASYPNEDRLRQVFDRLERHIEDRYAVPVRVRDVPDPFTGDLDGAEIHVDYDETVENAVFILIHLFGHTAQWNTSERSRELSRMLLPDGRGDAVTPQEWDELRAFELAACEISLTLLHEAGVHDLDQWVSDFAACDFAYLCHVYETGERPPLRSFWVEGAPLLRPRPIPSFHPTRWLGRWQGVVV